MTATAPAAPAKVYFTNLRTHARESQLDKLKRLIRHAGIEQIDFENKFVAIKIHFGELGNLSFLRPNYARAVADVVKELGGKPFLTDCNTLYVGSRKNALEHIDTAYQNGFTPYATGCQIIIADGLKGTDEALVPVEGGEYVHEAKIGQALMDADIVISLTHFKGHEQAGFGGAMKNLGMGGGSRAGKMEQHAAGKPSVDTANCVAAVPARGSARTTPSRLTARASASLPTVALARYTWPPSTTIAVWGVGAALRRATRTASSPTMTPRPMCSTTRSPSTPRPSLTAPELPHLACYGYQPQLRLHPENDTPIVNDIGMFASFDPVAIDQACADAVMRPSRCPTPSLPTARPRWSIIMSVWRASRPRIPSASRIPTPIGARASRMPRRSAWARASTSSSRLNSA